MRAIYIVTLFFTNKWKLQVTILGLPGISGAKYFKSPRWRLETFLGPANIKTVLDVVPVVRGIVTVLCVAHRASVTPPEST